MKRLDFCQNTKSPIFGSSWASNISSQKLGLVIFLTLRVCNFMQKNQKKNPILRSGTANGLTNKQMNSTKFIEHFHWCRCPRNNSTDEFSSASSKTGGWFIVCTARFFFTMQVPAWMQKIAHTSWKVLQMLQNMLILLCTTDAIFK